MLERVNELMGRKLLATDGEIGEVRDLYFDDAHWTVRYLVVATGGWFSGRDVLVSPASLDPARTPKEPVTAKLSRKEIEESPGVETDRPVSRQYEAAHARYFGYPYYWVGPHLWGPGAVPIAGPATAWRVAWPSDPAAEAVDEGKWGDTHLRSAKEVTRYRIEARDGAIGHVLDFLIDRESWAIRHMLVDTRNWLPGKHVLIAPRLIERVDWPVFAVHLRMTRDEVKRSPELGARF